MTNLDMLLLKGASSGNPEDVLRELRYTILTKGIPANSEGMVRDSISLQQTNNTQPSPRDHTLLPQTSKL